MVMAEDKRNRGDQQQGNPGEDRERRKDRKPGGMESPGTGRSRQQDEEEPQE
jgi:hypothetical protein